MTCMLLDEEDVLVHRLTPEQATRNDDSGDDTSDELLSFCLDEEREEQPA